MLLTLLLACAGSGEPEYTGNTSTSGSEGDSGDSGITGDSGIGDTGIGDSGLGINECYMSEPEDRDGDSTDDYVEMTGACILQDGIDAVNGNGTVKLIGGTSTFFGGATIEYGQTVTIEADTETSSTIVNGESGDDSSIITVQNGGNLFVDGNDQLTFGGYGTGLGVSVEAGGNAYVNYSTFNNLGIDVLNNGGYYNGEGNRHTLFNEIAIASYGNADTEIADFEIYKGINDSSITAAIDSNGTNDGDDSTASFLVLHGGYILGQNTELPTVTADADYVELLGVALEDNVSSSYNLDWTNGCEPKSETQQYSYGGSVTVGNSLHGPDGAARFSTACETVLHNFGFFGNEGIDGYADYVVDARDITGTATLTQSIIADNDADLGPVARPVDADDIPQEDNLVFSYNVINDNGDGDELFENLEGNNHVGTNPGTNEYMYDVQSGDFVYDAYQTENRALANAGNPNAQFPDWDGESDEAGTPGPWKGPVGDFFQVAVDALYDKFLNDSDGEAGDTGLDTGA